MTLKTKVLVGSATVAAVAGAGAAIAAGQLGDPREENEAVIDDAARQLNVAPSALSKALQEALVHRIDAAVAAGRLTQREGDAIKARIRSGELPLFFGAPPPGHFGGFHGLDVAASYLGLSEPELRAKLDGGKSLADVAKDQGKSVDGLVQALVDDAQKHLDEAVSQGRLTQAEERQVLDDLKQRITDFVNGDFPRGFGPGGPRFDGRGLPPVGPLFDRRALSAIT
jgi:hypothetical protein